MMKRLRLALLLLALPLLCGCMGMGAVPLPMDRLVSLRVELIAIDGDSPEELAERRRQLADEADRLKGVKDRTVQSERARKLLLLGYCWERGGEFDSASQNYYVAANSEYGSMAWSRLAQVKEYGLKSLEDRARDGKLPEEERLVAKALVQETRKSAMQALERCKMFPPGAQAFLRTSEVGSLKGGWELTVPDLRHKAYRRLDPYYRSTASYRVFETLVRICGGEDRSYAYVLALLLLAVLAKLVTTPLSVTQFRSMRAMQAITPELKRIQEKHKGDKAAAARAQMELFKEHKISPASSCLPMLMQIPILMWVYWGINHFTYRFMDKPFLYIRSLGDPDLFPPGVGPYPGPLIVVYGLSMYFSQKLMTTPAATPQQQQQQKMMTYMMPILFILLMKSLPAAFIFYWLAMNILMTGHQYLIMRPQRVAQAAEEAAAERPSGPPPEAIQKLSGGPRPQGKRKKRR